MCSWRRHPPFLHAICIGTLLSRGVTDMHTRISFSPDKNAQNTARDTMNHESSSQSLRSDKIFLWYITARGQSIKGPCSCILVTQDTRGWSRFSQKTGQIIACHRQSTIFADLPGWLGLRGCTLKSMAISHDVPTSTQWSYPNWAGKGHHPP